MTTGNGNGNGLVWTKKVVEDGMKDSTRTTRNMSKTVGINNRKAMAIKLKKRGAKSQTGKEPGSSDSSQSLIEHFC